MIFVSPIALDLAEYCVMLLEDDILFNAGTVICSSSSSSTFDKVMVCILVTS